MGQKLSEDHIYSTVKDKRRDRLEDGHLLPSKLQRYKRGHTFAERARSTLFNNADDVVDSVFCDICSGVSRADIVKKLMNTQYDTQKGQQRNMTYRTANEYYNTALDRMHYNTDLVHAELKDIFYNRYESLLLKAIKKDDIFNAKGILDSMAKIFLGNDINKNKIEINSNNDGQVVIKFGFNNDDDNEKIEDIECEEIDED